MKLKTILTFLTIFLSLAASAIPARKGIIPLTQPDGSTFNAVFRGDEFIRIKTTLEGHAIIQDHDGWWSYAYFNNDGQRFSSGCHVGSPVPPGILTQSRMIPYGKIHEKAAIRKRAMEGFKSTWDMAERMKAETRDGEIPTKHGIIILAQFKDVHFRYTKEDFNALLTENGYSAGKSIGSAKDYFDAQFKGRTLFDFQVSDIVTLNGNMASYGGNNSDGEDKDPAQMVVDACRLADEQIDFSNTMTTMTDSLTTYSCSSQETTKPKAEEKTAYGHIHGLSTAEPATTLPWTARRSTGTHVHQSCQKWETALRIHWPGSAHSAMNTATHSDFPTSMTPITRKAAEKRADYGTGRP